MLKLNKIYSAYPQLIKQTRIFSSTAIKLKFDSLNIPHKYDENQIQKILNVVNVKDHAELEKFNISKQRIKRIEIRKEKNGNFKNLDEILELDGFGLKVLEKFCDSILESKQQETPVEEKIPVKPVTLKKQQFVTPHLPESYRKSIRTCVSVQIGLDHVSWTKFYLKHNEDQTVRSMLVDDWENFDIGDDKKLNLTDYIQLTMLVNKKIPDADVYILEALPNIMQAKQPGSPVQMTINIQKYQLVAMMSALLANRGFVQEINPPMETNVTDGKLIHGQTQVYFMRNYLASKLFRVFIGNEKVSTETAIENILRYNYQEGDSSSGDATIQGVYINNMDVPLELRHVYNKANRVKKEYLGQSFLLGLTFIKLCIMKCPESISIVSRM